MKIIVLLAILSVLSIGVESRRLHQYGIKTFLHHLDLDVDQVQKRIFRDVLTDKDVSTSIADGKAGTEDFKKSVLKKTLSVIGNNDQYLKPLSKKVFAESSLNIDDDEKLKILKLGLNDETMQSLIVQDKGGDAIIKRLGQIIEKDNDLLQKLANQGFKDNELAKKMNDQQRAALLKIFLHNPDIIKKGTPTEDAIKTISKQIESNGDLKEFFQQNKDEFVNKLIKTR